MYSAEIDHRSGHEMHEGRHNEGPLLAVPLEASKARAAILTGPMSGLVDWRLLDFSARYERARLRRLVEDCFDFSLSG
jgi:hypothetical protein